MNFVHGAVLVKNCPTVITLQLRQLQQCRDKKKKTGVVNQRQFTVAFWISSSSWVVLRVFHEIPTTAVTGATQFTKHLLSAGCQPFTDELELARFLSVSIISETLSACLLIVPSSFRSVSVVCTRVQGMVAALVELCESSYFTVRVHRWVSYPVLE